jgi:hypothetical protein
MTELAASMREEQKKEDELERVIRNLKKHSKKRPSESTMLQRKNKRPRMENDHRNYEGSMEGLFTQNPTSGNDNSYDDRVEMALDEAIKLCDDKEDREANNCGTQDCGDDQSCGDMNLGEMTDCGRDNLTSNSRDVEWDVTNCEKKNVEGKLPQSF